MLWMALVGALWTLMEPSRRNDERLHEARVRVRMAIVRDPLFWLFVILACFAAIRIFNGDIVRLFDTREAKWVLNEPVTPLFPRAASGSGFHAFTLVVSLMVLATGCRQALGKSARVAFAAVLALVAGVLAVVLVFTCRLGHEGSLALAGCVAGVWPEMGLPVDSPLFVSSIGDAFGLAFLAAIVATAGLFECKWNKVLLLFSCALGATFIGLFYFSTPAAFCLFSVLGVVAIAGCYAYLALTQRAAVLLKFTVALLLAAGVPTLIILGLAPKEMTEFRLNLLQGMSTIPDGLFPAEFWQRRAELSAQARAFWDESHWLGQGVGSYSINLWLSGGAKLGLASSGTLNGWWFLLAERGILGVLMTALPLCFMTVSLVIRIIGAMGRHIFLPLPVLGVAGVLALAVSSCFGCSVWRADSLLMAGALYALAASSFPAPRKQLDEDDVAK